MKPSKLLIIQVDSDGTTFYHCKHCDYRSKNHTNAKVHQRIHSNHRPHVCDSCQYASNSASNLKKHLLQHTDVTFTCAHCPYASKSKQYLKRHMKSHLNPELQLDRLLGSTGAQDSFDSVVDLANQPGTQQASRVVEVFWCSLCHAYERPDFVQDHFQSSRHQSMVSKFPHRCGQCEAGFFEEISLSIHLQLVHQSTTRAHLQCGRCSYTTSSSILLDAHERVSHEGQPSFSCGWCHREFLLEASQREHVLQRLLLQTIEKRSRLSCSFCLKTFQHKDVVRKHEIETHSEISGASRLRCPVCKRVFRTKKSHREHLCRKRSSDEPLLYCPASAVGSNSVR